MNESTSTCCPDRKSVAAYVLGIGGALLLMAFLAWLMYRYTRPEEAGRAARAAERKKALTEIHAAEHDALTTYGWVAKDKGIVRLPVDRAVELSLELWKNPAAARSNLIERTEKAFPSAAQQKNQYD